jgi:hypothetical protein
MSRATFDIRVHSEKGSRRKFLILATIVLYLTKKNYILNGLFKTLGEFELSQSTNLAMIVVDINTITVSRLCRSLIMADTERCLSFEN